MEGRRKFFKVLDIITSIIILPVLVLALLCSFIMFSAKRHNQVPSIFGYSVVTILSGSMENQATEEFLEGSTVMVRHTNPDEIEVGDVIAFYDYVAPEDEDKLPEDYQPTTGGVEYTNTQFTLAEFLGVDSTEAAGSPVILHRVTEKLYSTNSETGETSIYFRTKGDNNGSLDPHYIRQDFVVGVYVEDANAGLMNFMGFCATPLGIILLVIVPAGIVLLMLSASIVEQASVIMAKNKETKRKQDEAEKMLQGDIDSRRAKVETKPEVIEPEKEEQAKDEPKETASKPKTEEKPAEAPKPVPPPPPPPSAGVPPKPPAKPAAAATTKATTAKPKTTAKKPAEPKVKEEKKVKITTVETPDGVKKTTKTTTTRRTTEKPKTSTPAKPATPPKAPPPPPPKPE